MLPVSSLNLIVCEMDRIADCSHRYVLASFQHNIALYINRELNLCRQLTNRKNCFATSGTLEKGNQNLIECRRHYCRVPIMDFVNRKLSESFCKKITSQIDNITAAPPLIIRSSFSPLFTYPNCRYYLWWLIRHYIYTSMLKYIYLW